jgi:glutamate-1-semialdehyde 2,1-aminomutase
MPASPDNPQGDAPVRAQHVEASERLFAEAQQVLPGGVSSPVRAFKAVGGTPRFMERGEGPYLYDADGNRYVDYVLSYGPLIAGHAHPRIVAALQEAVTRGTSFGAPTRLETELACRIQVAMPSLELVRFVSSGTEATMSALRVARAFTGRDAIVKVEGGYHGHADGLLARAGSGALTLGVPDSPGVPPAVAAATISVPFNDLGALEAALAAEPVAAVIVEPVPANMGVVLPVPGYLRAVRELTRRSGTLLIFDEVITGFRVAYGGAQGLYGISPDLTCLGKIIGGGLPVGAYGGRRDVMALVAPAGPVYQAGTLSGNPLAMTAGIAMLDLLSEPGIYEHLEGAGRRLHDGLAATARQFAVPAYGTRLGSMGTLFFTAAPVSDYSGARSADTTTYAHFFHGMLARGIYLAPSQFEAAFVSLAHDDEAIDETLRAAEDTFASFAGGG